MTTTDPTLIIAAKRTPMGHFNGAFSQVSAITLGSHAINGALSQANIAPGQISHAYMGCVLPAGLGQAPARQAALAAKLPDSTPATTINKMCGSGMQSIILAHQALQSGTTGALIAGGIENMTQAPYLLKKARFGYRIGADKIYDHMMLDGLEDAYQPGQSMGVFAEQCAAHHHITREQQDAFACQSYEKAKEAQDNGFFNDELTPVPVHTKKTETQIDMDEGIERFHPDKLPQLRPAFQKDGTVTAANASSISDGAAAIILAKESTANDLQIEPLARLSGFFSFAHEPKWFTTAPIHAIEGLLSTLSWSLDDVDLFEINEAFAVVPLAAMQALSIPIEKVNIHGGACVLGHPIGVSGTRIVGTLIYALRQKKLSKGIASICIGGGEALAVGIEII